MDNNGKRFISHQQKGAMTFQRPSNSDEILMLHSVQFADCLKDLKKLRKQLYSAAEYFESSYHKDEHKQVVIESSKDYITEALVSTVDHMGSVADKLTKFLDEKAGEIISTRTRFSCVERRLHMFQGFLHLRGIARHSLIPDTPMHHKQYNTQDGKLMVYRNCISYPPYDAINRSKKDNPFMKDFRGALIIKRQPLSSRKGGFRGFPSDSSPNQARFSFTRVLSSKEAGKRADSPPHFLLKRSGSTAQRSVSPCHSMNRQQVQWPGGARIVACLRPDEAMIRERQIIPYRKRSKNLLMALLSIHHSTKELGRARRS